MAKDLEPKPTLARFALAANVKHLMDKYSEGFKAGLSPIELERRCGVSHRTIKRIINPYADTGPSLDSIDRIAAFFGVEAWDLLRPRPALLQSDVTNSTPTQSKSRPRP